MIAALYVEEGGPYWHLEGVDPWGSKRDARLYGGPYPVVARPPCERWGRYATGGPNPRARRFKVGDDGGTFEAALHAVRTFGGVLEHPADSKAWEYFGIVRPPPTGWSNGDLYGGASCRVDQGRYGHPARKATWLYAKLPLYPTLDWARAPVVRRLEESFKSKEEARLARSDPGFIPRKRLSRRERVWTPVPFRDLLVRMAQSCSGS